MDRYQFEDKIDAAKRVEQHQQLLSKALKHMLGESAMENEVYVRTEPIPYSSVEIGTDAKGTPKPVVKVYHADPDEAATQALRIYENICFQLKLMQEEK